VNKKSTEHNQRNKKKNEQPAGFSKQMREFMKTYRVRLIIYVAVTIIFIVFITWRRLQLFPEIGLMKALGLGLVYGLVLFAVLLTNIMMGIYLRRSAERERESTIKRK
jgi:hypothetical protein